MHVFLERQILRRSERHLRCGDTLNGRVICQIDEKHRPVKGSGLPETLHKEVRLLECDPHCRKHNGKAFILSQHLCLSGDLRRQLSMRESRG